MKLCIHRQHSADQHADDSVFGPWQLVSFTETCTSNSATRRAKSELKVKGMNWLNGADAFISKLISILDNLLDRLGELLMSIQRVVLPSVRLFSGASMGRRSNLA